MSSLDGTRTDRLARRAILVVGLLVVCAAFLGGTGRSSTSADGLQCAEHDVGLDAIVEVGTDVPGGPSNPRAALAGFVRQQRQLQPLEPEAFQQSPHPSGRVRMTLVSESRVLALADVEQVGDSWYVTYLASCGEALRGRPR